MDHWKEYPLTIVRLVVHNACDPGCGFLHRMSTLPAVLSQRDEVAEA